MRSPQWLRAGSVTLAAALVMGGVGVPQVQAAAEDVFPPGEVVGGGAGAFEAAASNASGEATFRIEDVASEQAASSAAFSDAAGDDDFTGLSNPVGARGGMVGTPPPLRVGLHRFNAGSGSGGSTFVVPEPGSFAAVGIGAMVLAGRRRRRRC